MNILDLLENKDLLVEYISNSHYADIAEELEDLEVEDVHSLYTLIDVEDFANILIECSLDFIKDVVSEFSDEEIIRIVSILKSDDAVDVIGCADFGKQKAILRKMKQTDQKEYSILLGYDKDSAGGLMSTEFVALKSTLTIKEALKKLHDIELDSSDYIDLIYIVDVRKVLIGFVKLKTLVLSEPVQKLDEVMNTFVISVKVSEDQEVVADLVKKYDMAAIPVVNNNENILGIITVDDVIDVIVEEQSEDMLRLGGVISDVSSEASVIQGIKSRLPWLMINLLTAFFASFIVSLFDNVINQVVALAVAMPIVAGMGGNAGTQALSVMIRNIAVNDADLSSEWKKSYREIIIGCFNGFVTGLIAGTALSLYFDNFYLGLVLLLSMIGNLMVAGLFGYMIPLILKRLNFDPALASAIFITTATDVFGFFLFLGLASLLLQYLI